MRKDRAEKELERVKEKIQELSQREKELEHFIREVEKEETAVIMEKYNISAEELLELLKEREAENQRILERKENDKNEVHTVG